MHHENTERFPRGEAKLADQIKRSSRAVPALFAEGARRRSPSDRAYYFDMSAGSARETSAHVDVAHVSMLISVDDRLKIRQVRSHLRDALQIPMIRGSGRESAGR